MKNFQDRYERAIDYLRISVTDRCNLRCIYCVPPKGIKHLRFGDLLKYEEIERLVRIAARLGVRKVRLTGGEPLVRKNLHVLVESLNRIAGIEDISLTTNGQLLKACAHILAEAGLRRVNISLDSLRPDRYRNITRGGDIRDVFEGVYRAEKAGLFPVKINMIPIRGINDDEIENFALLTRYSSYHVRFIEFMPLAPRKLWAEKKYVSTDEIKGRVASIAPIVPVKMRKFGPARYYRFPGSSGVIGFISPLTNHFCSSCNRLRLTSDGKLRPCLFSENEIDIKSAIRSGAADDEIERLLKLSVEIKPERHSISPGTCCGHLKSMSRIGG